MRIQRYQREKTIGTHNFDCFQLYIGSISDPKGRFYKGMTVLWAGGANIETPIPLSKDEALRFADYLESVVAGTLPSKYIVKGYGYWIFNGMLNLHLKFSKVENNDIKCRMSFSANTMWGRVNMKSIDAAASSLRVLYKNA